ncbi:hypothetical protein A3J23_01240 [Candidatus Peregrinibacteria bacterium RIFCSPLOWO2_02_FULL_48_14]|nr:MAG: hypothetical protein A2974_00490 [Candidatus Peregrinibacteria bacterium RIFCSPLOWO2_01_FULL_48_20]OGJ44956.1 MAG: hypothetical protein A3J23_01240 [Candidatus Peregrinibacteria bacterium RIFCSPLOWO2_02_FULL_48_14]
MKLKQSHIALGAAVLAAPAAYLASQKIECARFAWGGADGSNLSIWSDFNDDGTCRVEYEEGGNPRGNRTVEGMKSSLLKANFENVPRFRAWLFQMGIGDASSDEVRSDVIEFAIDQVSREEKAEDIAYRSLRRSSDWSQLIWGGDELIVKEFQAKSITVGVHRSASKGSKLRIVATCVAYNESIQEIVYGGKYTVESQADFSPSLSAGEITEAYHPTLPLIVGGSKPAPLPDDFPIYRDFAGVDLAGAIKKIGEGVGGDRTEAAEFCRAALSVLLDKGQKE